MPAMEMLRKEPMSLIVSLPANDVSLARAAVDGGADMLKVHIHVQHAASGTGFGSLTEEKEALAGIMAAVDLPVGLMIGAEEICDEAELAVVEEMGFAFVDAYAHHMPAWLFSQTKLPRMVAVEEGDMTDAVAVHLSRIGLDALEAAIIGHEGYGLPLNVRDLAHYDRLSFMIDVPVVVPTQRAVRPDEVFALRDVGVSGIMIGAIVTGRSPGGIEKATGDFRRMIGRL